MKAGIVSDTHGNTDNLKEAVEWLTGREGVSAVIHAGDDSCDMLRLRIPGVRVITVPGLFEPAYSDSRVPNRVIEEFSGIRVFITHSPVSGDKDTPGDLSPERVIAEASADVMVHGHTHRPGIQKKGAVTVINPGHLRNFDKRGSRASFAVLDFTAREAKIISLEGKEVIMRKTF